ncbi:unnamed protein product [Microthlaspi erraticum]|uniref:SHSP domain-containing protein n=1 Tax=Microthlaspi erraticum TaxID=1685480 RepID=A0A6D2J2J6_9BRAS|nr:unnamed protein product [Microthlaspi erraticum]
MPFNGPSSVHTSMSSDNNKANENGEKKEGPSVTFLPYGPNADFYNIIDQTKICVVALTGSASMGKIGFPIGEIDIAESDDTYFFRVALPSVSPDEKDFSCNIEPEGTVMIKGITTMGKETVCRHSQVFKMLA